MTKTLTITLSDEQYAALQATAAREQQSPEEVAAAAVANQLGSVTSSAADKGDQVARSRATLLAVMRARGHLVDPSTLPPYPGAADIPPRGTPERQRFEDELGDALSDALDRSGLSILDLIERR
jgi:predicted transcriptional regulator